jgi:hypothetical protein
MGEVYKAIDTRLGRTVAIKVLASSHAERFQQEARAIAALSHVVEPGTCPRTAGARHVGDQDDSGAAFTLSGNHSVTQ